MPNQFTNRLWDAKRIARLRSMVMAKMEPAAIAEAMGISEGACNAAAHKYLKCTIRGKIALKRWIWDEQQIARLKSALLREKNTRKAAIALGISKFGASKAAAKYCPGWVRLAREPLPIAEPKAADDNAQASEWRAVARSSSSLLDRLVAAHPLGAPDSMVSIARHERDVRRNRLWV